MAVAAADFAAVENADRPASLKDLARSRGLEARPVGLRELITAQRPRAAAPTLQAPWVNWLADHGVAPSPARFPHDREAVFEAMRDAARRGGAFRAVGSGHSHSKAAKPEGSYASLRSTYGAISEMDVGRLLISGSATVRDVLQDHLPDSPSDLRALIENFREAISEADPAALKEALIDAVTGSGDVDRVTAATGLSPEDFLREVAERLGGSLESLLPDEGFLKADPPGLAPGETPVRVAAGTALKQLNRIHLARRGLALRNMGSFDGQTLAGAVNTATHGSGVRLATLADDVLSAEMVCVTRSRAGEPLVRFLRIEPTDGITDRAAFEADTTEHETALIQDDETFAAVVAGYGCCGVAVAYTIRTVDEYWLREETDLPPWSYLRPQLEGPTRTIPGVGEVPEFVDQARHVAFYFNTARAQVSGSAEDVLCLVLKQDIPEPRVPDDPDPTEREKGFWEWLTAPLQDFGVNPSKTRKNVAFGVDNTYFRPRHNTDPFKGGHATASYIALRREKEDRPPNVPPEPPPSAISSEIAVPATKVAKAMDRVIELILESDVFFAVPIGVRFTAPSGQLLAPEHGRAVALIEIPFPVEPELYNVLRGRKRMVELRDDYAKPELAKIVRALRDDPELQGRPHLGKHHGLDADALAATFPEADRWKRVRARLDPFDVCGNAFSRELGL